MKNKNKLVNFILFLFSLLILAAFFTLFKKWSANASDIGDIQNIVSQNKNYNLLPLNIDLSNVEIINYVSRTRPLSNIRHLRELINDFKINNKMEEDWIFLTKKRVEILQGYSKSDIIGNYKNLDQLVGWHKENRPKDWEFWKYKELESWEGSLAEIYLLTKEVIDYINKTNGTKTERIERLLPVAGVLQQHQKRLNWTIKDWPMTNKEREYLAKMSNNVFSNLFDEIYKTVPRYSPNVYYFSFLPVIKENNFGQYNLWFETGWFEKGKVKILVETNDLEADNLNFFVEDRYGLNIGNLSVASDTKELMVKIQFPENFVINTQPKIWLNRIAFIENAPRIQTNRLSEVLYRVKTENLSSEQEKKLLDIRKARWILKDKKKLSEGIFEYYFTDLTKYIFLLLLIVFFGISLLLELNYFEKINLRELFLKFKKRLSFVFNILFSFVLSKIKFNKTNSSFLVIIYIAGVFLVGKNWDFLTVWTFIFLTIFSLIWKLSSNVHFIAALFLMLCSPIFVLLKKESWTETLAVISFFFLLSGAIQNIREEKSGEVVETKNRLLLREILKSFLYFILFSAIIALILNLLIEFIVYKDFFGANSIHEFINKVPLKLFALWLSVGILLELLFRCINKKALKLRTFLERSDFSLKKIFTTLFCLLLSVSSFFLLKNIRISFKDKPYILKISENSASPETLITILGKNFLNNEGKVLINGTVQVVKQWGNEKIVFEVTDKFSSDGKIQVTNSYKRGTLESNKIDFIFIDTSPPAEYELDL